MRPALNSPSLVQALGGAGGGFSYLPAHVGLSGRRRPGPAGEQKTSNPPKSGDIFAKLCHGIGQVWAVARGHKENQPPRAGGDERAVKCSQRLQAGERLPCRTIFHCQGFSGCLRNRHGFLRAFIKKDLCGSQSAQVVNYIGINPKYIFFKKQKSRLFFLLFF